MSKLNYNIFKKEWTEKKGDCVEELREFLKELTGNYQPTIIDSNGNIEIDFNVEITSEQKAILKRFLEEKA